MKRNVCGQFEKRSVAERKPARFQPFLLGHVRQNSYNAISIRTVFKFLWELLIVGAHRWRLASTFTLFLIFRLMKRHYEKVIWRDDGVATRATNGFCRSTGSGKYPALTGRTLKHRYSRLKHFWTFPFLRIPLG